MVWPYRHGEPPALLEQEIAVPQADSGHHASRSPLARTRCPRCRCPGMRSLGFTRARDGYVRRIACPACLHVCNDEEAVLRSVKPAMRGPAAGREDGISDADREAVETIALLLGSGGAGLDDMEVSDASIDEFIAAHGQPTSFLRGFAFPAFCWRKEHIAGMDNWLVVINQGRKRVCFNTRRPASQDCPGGAGDAPVNGGG